jgi:AmmeMemoRadiSam system protein A
VLTGKEKNLLLDLARKAVRDVIDGDGTDMAAPGMELTDALQEKEGVFVAIYNGGSLRGCMGTVLGILPLWQACMEYARSAAIKDVRFSPIKSDELASLSFELTIISPLRMLDDLSKLRPGRDGLMLRKGFRKEAFLPGSISNLIKKGAEAFDLLKAKAGIDPEDDSPEEWEAFETEVISDKR